MYKFPTFFIVGAMKSGTTSIHNYLNLHPDIYMSPIKEPHYFSKDIQCNGFEPDYRKSVCFDQEKYFSHVQLTTKHAAYIESEKYYLRLFDNAKPDQERGESSVGYLYSHVAAEEIYKKVPDAKIVIVLRNPVERAFSHWLMDLRGGNADSDHFLDAIDSDYNAKVKSWGNSHLYIELGEYYAQVKRYLDFFGIEQVKVILFDDLIKSKESTLNEIVEFLQVNKFDIGPELQEHNKAKLPKFPIIQKCLRKSRLVPVVKMMVSEKIACNIKNILYSHEHLPKLSDSERNILLTYFESDCRELFKLLKREERNWFRTPAPILDQ